MNELHSIEWNAAVAEQYVAAAKIDALGPQDADEVIAIVHHAHCDILDNLLERPSSAEWRSAYKIVTDAVRRWRRRLHRLLALRSVETLAADGRAVLARVSEATSSIPTQADRVRR